MGGGRGTMGSHQPSYVPDHGDGSYHDGYGAPRGQPYDPYMQHGTPNEP